MAFSCFPNIITGSTLGLFAGLVPGPMMALILSQTMQYGFKEGGKVAVTPLITDPPIIAAAWLFFKQVSGIQPLLGIISLCGAVYLGFLGFEAFRVSSQDVNLDNQLPKSLFKGTMTNLLNPHPYVFWFSVGIPILTTPDNHQVRSALVFLVCFYTLLVGSKITMALVVAKGKFLVESSIYFWLMKILGCALWIFGLLFLIKGVRILLSLLYNIQI